MVTGFNFAPLCNILITSVMFHYVLSLCHGDDLLRCRLTAGSGKCVYTVMQCVRFDVFLTVSLCACFPFAAGMFWSRQTACSTCRQTSSPCKLSRLSASTTTRTLGYRSFLRDIAQPRRIILTRGMVQRYDPLDKPFALSAFAAVSESSLSG